MQENDSSLHFIGRAAGARRCRGEDAEIGACRVDAHARLLTTILYPAGPHNANPSQNHQAPGLKTRASGRDTLGKYHILKLRLEKVRRVARVLLVEAPEPPVHDVRGRPLERRDERAEVPRDRAREEAPVRRLRGRAVEVPRARQGLERDAEPRRRRAGPRVVARQPEQARGLRERERAQQRPRRAVERQVEHRALVRRQLRAARRQEEADLGDVARPLDRRGALRRVDHLEVDQDRPAGDDEAEPVDAEGAHCRLAAECQLATAEPGAEWEIVVAAAMALMRIRLFLGHPIGCRQVYKNTLPWWPRFSLLLLFSLCRMRRRWYKL